MAKPYSIDLRARVVSDIAEGATLAETADHHHVSLSSVVRFLRLKRNTGNIRPAKFGGCKPYSLATHEKLHRLLVAQHGDKGAVDQTEDQCRPELDLSFSTPFATHL